ncbi:MAG TPA: hypothetical protein DEF02_03810 [Clostridiales bacterium]|nr:hypothetical protein [Clostridiales bacterium]
MFFIRFFIRPRCKKVPFCANRNTILTQFQNSAPKIEYRFLLVNILSVPPFLLYFSSNYFPILQKFCALQIYFFNPLDNFSYLSYHKQALNIAG